MEEYWLFISDSDSKNNLFLPLDLFKISVEINNGSSLDKFVEFIKNWIESKGYYYNSNFMNSQIKIDCWISDNILIIGRLYRYIDALKSIQVKPNIRLLDKISLNVTATVLLNAIDNAYTEMNKINCNSILINRNIFINF